MQCSKCNQKAVSDTRFCKKHFIDDFEKTVKETIKQFKLISAQDKIIVAVSGGKDSITTLSILANNYANVSALAIDEGIKEYRENTLKDLTFFCKQKKIPLKVYSFKKEFGQTLDQILKANPKMHPCTVCGVLRRFLLNKYSRGFDVIATGHNLDDEAQTIMMNLFKDQPDLLARLGPKTGLAVSSRFTKRVKPLYFIPEKHVRIYTFLKGFDVSFNECTYTHDSFRGEIQQLLNMLEQKNPGTKRGIVDSFLRILPKLKAEYKTKEELGLCKKCKEPSAKETCNTCNLLASLKK